MELTLMQQKKVKQICSAVKVMNVLDFILEFQAKPHDVRQQSQEFSRGEIEIIKCTDKITFLFSLYTIFYIYKIMINKIQNKNRNPICISQKSGMLYMQEVLPSTSQKNLKFKN